MLARMILALALVAAALPAAQPAAAQTRPEPGQKSPDTASLNQTPVQTQKVQQPTRQPMIGAGPAQGQPENPVNRQTTQGNEAQQ